MGKPTHTQFVSFATSREEKGEEVGDYPSRYILARNSSVQLMPDNPARGGGGEEDYCMCVGKTPCILSGTYHLPEVAAPKAYLRMVT